MSIIALSNRSRWVPALAWVAGGAFVFATLYCICEAIGANVAHAEDSHQHAPAGHHEESSSNNEYDPCCATLQAVVTPQASLFLAGTSQLLFQEVPLRAATTTRRVDLSFVP
ncbi:MAG: hypothetical protein Q8R78_00815, partial [Candidatus Omnitrophota bacterium]|nr:hypothetical protein [Candidatus Omnitrophota bacterium]